MKPNTLRSGRKERLKSDAWVILFLEWLFWFCSLLCGYLVSWGIVVVDVRLFKLGRRAFCLRVLFLDWLIGWISIAE